MKVVLWGGSAQSTPALCAYLGQQAIKQIIDLILIGRSASRLAAVARACRMLVNAKPIRIHTHLSDNADLGDILDAADLIVVQVRVGGYDGRSFDESMPLRYGICGDQDLGPGAMSAAWRVWPEIRKILGSCITHAPASRIIMLSSPVSILVGAASVAFPRLNVAGICELPWQTLVRVARELAIPPMELEIDYHGVNHFGWFHGIRHGARDVLAELRSSPVKYQGVPGIRDLETYRCLPTPYVALHTAPDQALLHMQSRSVDRAFELAMIREHVFPVFRNGSSAQIKEVLQLRRADWYEFAIGPLILGLSSAKVAARIFLSIPVSTDTFSETLAGMTETVEEMPHDMVDCTLLRSDQNAPVPLNIRDIVKEVQEFEIQCVRAVLGKSSNALVDAIFQHPWVRDMDIAKQMAADIIGLGRGESFRSIGTYVQQSTEA